MKTSLGIWAFGAMATRFNPGGYKPALAGATTAVADCIEGRCQSRNSATTSACGAQKCTEAQYCEQFVGGPAGSEPSYTCRPLGDCQDCACLNVIGCQCSETDGAIKVFCAAP